jgi:ABC-type iron transport system FetAB ATPase subunit
MDWSVSRLSSGEQQRLSLARLLQNQPHALLLDEPTASLDAQNIQRVECVIDEYQRSQHCSIIWVTHDRGQAARIARRHYVLQENRLIEHTEGDNQ